MIDRTRPPGARVRRKVSVAILVIDDFTNQVIQGQNIRVNRAETGQKAIRKSDGYHIFTNCSESTILIRVTAPDYYTEQIAVRPDILDPLNPVVKIRLKPNRLYALPSGITCVSGKAPPGSVIMLVHENDPKPLKLLYDYNAQKDGDTLSLFHPKELDLEGKVLVIREREKPQQEFFFVSKAVGGQEGVYRLENPLEHSYRKIGSDVLVAYTTQADMQGNYFLPIRNLAGEECKCILRSVGIQVVEKQAVIVERKETVIDLL